MKITETLEPRSVFSFFEALCGIPHGSGNCGAISNYLASFGRERGLETYQDAAGNVILRKAGTAGYEHAAPVILQGHMDMVCEKAPDCDKDMTTEGLDLAIDGDILYAKGTTLGGDNGIGVAIALALLDSHDLPHPPLEAIFTVDEEIGMLGASAMEDLSMIRGRTMLNLDSEGEGIFTVSCAGGNMTRVTLPLARVSQAGKLCSVTVGGLQGGHSGVEIHRGLGNACRLLARVLYASSAVSRIRLISLQGGAKDNAIPREASALLLAEDADALQAFCREMDSVLKNEYRVTDPNVFVTCQREASQADSMLPLTAEAQARVLTFLQCAPCGIEAMSADIDGLVQTSLNLGILTTKEDVCEVSFCVRSSVESQKQMLVERITCLAEALGGTVGVFGSYSGWEYRANSPLRDCLVEVYREQYGKEPRLEAIHAGVECGIFAGKLEGLDCVSIGPDLTEIHTTEEKTHIASVSRLWRMLTEVLRRMK